MQRFLIGLIIVTFIVSACIKTEPVSPIPEITFKSLSLADVDTSLDNVLLGGVLVFDFIDGDADIGVETADANNTNLSDSVRYNLFLTPYSKIDGNYSLIEYDSIPPYYSILRDDKLDRVGQNKTIKGTITVVIVDLPPYDTIRYDFMLRDRAGHNSNVETTTDLGTSAVLK